MANLLRNGSFEGQWRDLNARQQIPNEWEFWADERTPNPFSGESYNRFGQPEVRVMLKAQLPAAEWVPFGLDGGQLLHVFGAAFYVGFVQDVSLVAGHYRLTAQIFPDVVERYDGADKVFAEDPNACRIRFVYRDGGNTAHVSEWLQLKAGVLHRPSWEFDVERDEAGKVVVQFMAPFNLQPPQGSNGIFCDAWTLEEIVVPEPPPPPPPPGCIPLREPLALVGFLASPRESLKDLITRLGPVWDVFRWSMFGSADHAATSCNAGSQTVLASNADDWSGSGGTLESFFETYYPDVTLIPFAHDSDFRLRGRAAAAGLLAAGIRLAYPSTHRPPLVTSNFGNLRDYGPHEGLDLRSSYRSWGDRALAAFPGKVVVAGWSTAEPYYGYQVKTATPILDGYTLYINYAHMVQGSLTVDVGDQVAVGQVLGFPDSTGKNADGTPSSTGDHLHFGVLLVGPNIPAGTKLWCDPEILIDFNVTPDNQPSAPLPGEFVSIHRQTPVDGWLQFVAETQPRWYKLVGDMEAAKEIKTVSPGTKVLYRHHKDDQEPFYRDEDVGRAVNNWLAEFWAGIEVNAQWIDAVEGLNEEIPTIAGDPTRRDKMLRVVRFETALSNEIARRDIGVGCVLLNVAGGNPGHDEVEHLLPAAMAAVHNRHWLGDHPYFPAHTTFTEKWMEEEGKHYHLRPLLSWDVVFAQNGINPRYLFNEGGGVGAHLREDGRPGGYISSASGWRSPDCLNGNWPRYLALLLAWREQVAEWNKWHDNRAEGAMLFTVGGGDRWKHFNLWKPEMQALAGAIT